MGENGLSNLKSYIDLKLEHEKIARVRWKDDNEIQKFRIFLVNKGLMDQHEKRRPPWIRQKNGLTTSYKEELEVSITKCSIHFVNKEMNILVAPR